MSYIYQHKDWPDFHWDAEELSTGLGNVRHKQGKLLGAMGALGFDLQSEAFLDILSTDAIKTSEIEGEILNPEQVRSSVARHLGITIAHSVPSGRDVDGVVEMLLDATQKFEEPLTKERLFMWHALLFPATGKKRHIKNIGGWRSDTAGPMQVISGAIGKEKIHFQAPPAKQVEKEMKRFLAWFNSDVNIDPVLKAAISHFWFVTIHPFEDGNGRIARAIADMQLARADKSPQRFYSMSARIQHDWRDYYWILEQTQKGSLDITKLLYWFLECLNLSLGAAEGLLAKVKTKAKFWDKASGASLNERQRLVLNKLLDGFEGKLTTVKWAKLAKCSHDTALRDINNLIEKEILEKDEAGGRSAGYNLVVG
jgi:Fic family protein